MMHLPTIDAALIKVTGVFSYQRKEIQRLVKAGFDSIPLVDDLPPNETTNREAWLKKEVDKAWRLVEQAKEKEEKARKKRVK